MHSHGKSGAQTTGRQYIRSKKARISRSFIRTYFSAMLVDSTPAGLYETQEILSYLHTSAAVLLAFDWFLTFEAEVKYTWNAPWNFGRILFVGTRYPVFIDTALLLYHDAEYYLLAQSTCNVLDKVVGYMQAFGFVWAEAILTIRVWALWGRGRKIGLSLIAVSVVNTTLGLLGIFGLPHHSVQIDSPSPTATAGCSFIAQNTSLVWVTFTSLTVQLAVIFTMTMIKAFQHYRTNIYGASLLRTFYIDGIIYFLTLQVLSILNLTIVFKLSQTSSTYSINPLTTTQRVFHSILTARILLNLRKQASGTSHISTRGSGTLIFT